MQPVILGYYPSWETGVRPDDLRFERFTHLCYAFATGRKDGTLIADATIKSAKLTDAAHRRGVKVLLSVGGAGSGDRFLNAMADDEAALERYITSLTQLVGQYHYDGVDVDWESPASAKDRGNLVKFVKRLRESLKLRDPNALVTMAVSSGDYSGQWFDMKALKDDVDLLHVMYYDLHGPWSGHAGHNAPMGRVPADEKLHGGNDPITPERAVAYWTQVPGKHEWPKEKLLLGIPLYGRGFQAKQWYDPASSKEYERTYVNYQDALKLVSEGWEKHWDDAAQVPWFSNPGMDEVISYDDERSVELKGKWAKKNGLRGVFFWEVSQDFIGGDHVLVKAARKGFGLDER
jgi:chitinase